MSTSAKSSSKNPKLPKTEEKPRGLFSRLNTRFPWLKLVTVIYLGLIIILDLLDLTISKTDNLTDDFPTTPFSKHVKATERDLKNKKLVALTFDDGPSPETTPRLLNILTEKNTLATFFVLGYMAENNPDIIRRMNREAHEIASHTMYHQNLPTLSWDGIAHEINAANDVYRGILGRNPTLLRPPYGNINNNVRNIANLPLILWSVDTLDWKNRNPDTILEITMNQVHDGAIILMHDIHPTSVDAVPRLIDTLRENDYEFVTVSELVAARKVELAPGASYFNFEP